ncbi:hypothetical protein BJX62DRAFT_211930 [Aspergillus germanicus]
MLFHQSTAWASSASWLDVSIALEFASFYIVRCPSRLELSRSQSIIRSKLLSSPKFLSLVFHFIWPRRINASIQTQRSRVDTKLSQSGAEPKFQSSPTEQDSVESATKNAAQLSLLRS